MYSLTLGQLNKTYRCVWVLSMVDISKVDEALTTLPIAGNKVLNWVLSRLDESSTHEGLFILVSTPSIYWQNKERTSSARYPSTIEPSGCALFRTYDFKGHKYLKHDFSIRPIKLNTSKNYKVWQKYLPFNGIHPTIMYRTS